MSRRRNEDNSGGIGAVYLALGQWIRRRRQHFTMTQAELGERMGLSRTSIVNIEQGRQRILLHQFVMLGEILDPQNPELAEKQFRDGLARDPVKARAFLSHLFTKDPS